MQGRTKPSLLQRYLGLSSGEVLDMRKVEADVQRLSSLGIFDAVSARPIFASVPLRAGAVAGDASEGDVSASRGEEGDSVRAVEERIGSGDRIDMEFHVTEKKKFGQFSCQGGATMVRVGLGCALHAC
jgi:hypothetical protein